MPQRSGTAVSFTNVSRAFGEVRAVDDVSFDIHDGEFFSMLGPSGSGKTTCLRLIAGFERPDAGHISVHGVNVEAVPPYERDVNTVFQDYALFPHMSVSENVQYGLMIRKVPEAERRRRSTEMLSLVKLESMGSRKPSQLSGGQRQRVALARALINRPSVLLLDEPLGALDLKLREQMQEELKALQRQVGITFVYVTHDQGEALAMSDRIAVFNRGRIEQVGAPDQIYEHPTTVFVADFVGVANVCTGQFAQRLNGSPREFAIRPEKILMLSMDEPVSEGWTDCAGTIRSVTYHGATTRYAVSLKEGGELAVMCQNGVSSARRMVTGDAVRLTWPRHSIQHLGP
ncbi:MAG: ABC transporter ATP-binding protein [Burkholderiales bacterium]